MRSIRFVVKPEGVNNIILTIYTKPLGVNGNLGVERHHAEGGLTPPPTHTHTHTKSSTDYA